ncbi:hypothetical protein ACO0QE_004502 [Hanseniaspora vineae]
MSFHNRVLRTRTLLSRNFAKQHILEKYFLYSKNTASKNYTTQTNQNVTETTGNAHKLHHTHHRHRRPTKYHWKTQDAQTESQADLNDSLSNKFTYNTRFNIEKLIKDYASEPLLPISEIWKSYSSQYLIDNDVSVDNATTEKIATSTLSRKHLSSQQLYGLNLQTINLLMIYTCKRIKAFGELPYIAVINPKIEEVNKLYYQTLQDLLLMIDDATKYIDMGDHKRMIDALNKFIDNHNDSLIPLSVGLQEVVQDNWLMKDYMSDFLNIHLRDRIVMKTLASHHLEILKQNVSTCGDNSPVEKTTKEDFIGIISPALKISSLIQQVQEFVSDLCFVKYDQQVPIDIKYGHDITFPCIPTDLEYIMTELLKNSSRAHIENGKADVPIEITIVKTRGQTCKENDRKMFEELEIRIRDFGGGIPPLVEDKILDYSFSTVTKETKNSGMMDNQLPGEQVNTVSGMGFGLPLCKAYLDIYDGVLDVQSLYGYGTDVYIKFKSTLN